MRFAKLLFVVLFAVFIGVAASAAAPTPAQAEPGIPGVFSEPEWFPLRSTDGDIEMGCAERSCPGGYHGYWALDFGADQGHPVYAAGAGKVVNVVRGNDVNCGATGSCKGNAVTIDHGGGVFSYYTHFVSIPTWIKGDTDPGGPSWVDPDTVIGRVGDTGRSTRDYFHLHFEVSDSRFWVEGRQQDPGRLKSCIGGKLTRHPVVEGASFDSWNAVPRYAPLYNEGTDCTTEAFQATPGGGGWSDWRQLSGRATDIAAATGGDGRIEMFHIGTDGRMFHAWQTDVGGAWSDWQAQPGSATDLALAAGGDGRLEMFHVGGNGRVFHRWQWEVGGGWSSWNEVSGQTMTRLALEANADGRLELFGVGTDGHLYHRWQWEPGGGWSDWVRFYDGSYRDVAAGRNADGTLEVYTVGSGGDLAHRWQREPGGDWTAWASAGTTASAVELASNADGRLEVLVARPDGSMVVRWQVAPNRGWSGWNTVRGEAARVAMATDGNGHLHAFHAGSDGSMWEKWQLFPSGQSPTGTVGHGGPAPGTEPAVSAARLVTDACDTAPCAGTMLRHSPRLAGDAAIPAAIPDGQALSASCHVQGERVTGPSGSTTTWSFVSYAGHSGFVPNAQVRMTDGSTVDCSTGGAPVGIQPDAGTLSDIAGTTHEDAIRSIINAGITQGYPNGTYRPGEPVTRGQMATFLTRALELPGSEVGTLSDIAGTTHEDAIRSIIDAGITQGYPNGTFRPGEPVTRGQMATFLTRALELPGSEVGTLSDITGTTHEDAIRSIINAGITQGYPNGTYRPGEPVTRGQMATFLTRALELP